MEHMSNTDIVTQNTGLALLRPIASPKEILAAQAATTAVILETLKEGIDYGLIPGTGKKAGLFKAGAERLNNAFGVYPFYTITEQEVDHNAASTWVKRTKKWNNKTRDDKTFTWAEEKGESLGLYRYVVRCDLKIRGSDVVIASAIGVCSSLESKYIDRPRDCENTILKMGEKRAMVGATLHAYGLSDRFTQDVEDIADNMAASTGAEVVDAVIVPDPVAPAAKATAPRAERVMSPEGKRLLGLLPVEGDRRTFKMAFTALKLDWAAFVMTGPEDETPEAFKERAATVLGALKASPETEAAPVAPAAEPAPSPTPNTYNTHPHECGCDACTAQFNAILDARILADQAGKAAA